MTSLRNKDIKLTYFDARIKGEPIRLLLAFGGYEYELWCKYFIKVKCMWSYKVHRWAGSASLGRPGRLAGSEALLLLGPPSLPHSRRGENLRVNGHLQEPNILYYINLKANVFLVTACLYPNKLTTRLKLIIENTYFFPDTWRARWAWAARPAWRMPWWMRLLMWSKTSSTKMWVMSCCCLFFSFGLYIYFLV